MPESEAEGAAVPESQNPEEISFAQPRGARRRRRIGAGVVLGAGAAAAVAVALGAGPSSSQGASQPAKSSGSATVARRDLVSTDTESGTLGYANAQTVFNRLSGTITSLPVVGKVIDPGQTLYRVDGAPVVLFDGATPAYRDLSDGVSNGLDVQELKLNLKALGFDPDHQISVNQTFDAATTAAVDRWQASLGQTQTGTVSLGQIVFLPGPQRITQVDTVLGSTGGASSGSAGSGAATTTSGTPATGSTLSAGTGVAAPRAEFVDLTTKSVVSQSGKTPPTCPTTVTNQIATSGSDTRAIRQTKQEIAAICRQPTTSASKTASQTLAALIALLRAETLVLKRASSGSSTGAGTGTGTARTGGGTGSSTGSSSGSGGGRNSAAATGGSGAAASSGGGSSSGGSSSAGSASSGTAGSGGTAQAILQTTSTQLVVTVDLDATKQSEAVVGAPVTVQLPSGGTVDGKITGVSPVAQTASSSSSSSSAGGGGGGSSSSTPSATVPVTITLQGHRPATGLDQAAVSVNFEQQVENNVLSVPVTALLATAGGGYAVQEASAPHRLIPVTPGLFAAGFVQVSGAGIYPGLAITDSQG